MMRVRSLRVPTMMRPQDPPSIPEETRRVARAAFPKGTLCLRIADALGSVYQDSQFAALFPSHGQPAAAPGRLALAVVLQFMENLSDREAADAVRGRIDWKYALGLALTDPGFDHTVLSEFRTRLITGNAGPLLLDSLLRRLQEQGLVKARGRQRTDSTHVLAAVRTLNRLERVGETMRAALNELAAVAPEWLQAMAPAAWYERYGRRVENYRLPKTEAARQDLAALIGADGQQLLSAVDTAIQQPELGLLPAVQVLCQVWATQYVTQDGRMRLGGAAELPRSAEQICSPYDPEARYSNKRDTSWAGYKVQVTETCDPACEGPHVITNVETTPATTPDDNMVAVVHQSLDKRGLLPGEHLVDKGYTDSHVLVDSQQNHGVTIIGPVADDPSWQARLDDGLTKSEFGQGCGVVRWHPYRENAPLTLCCASDRGLISRRLRHQRHCWERAQQGEYWLDAGLYLEYARGWRGQPDEFETKILLEKAVQPLVLTANLIFNKQAGQNADKGIGFEYGVRAKWPWTRGLQFGVEAFGESGSNITRLDRYCWGGSMSRIFREFSATRSAICSGSRQQAQKGR